VKSSIILGVTLSLVLSAFGFAGQSSATIQARDAWIRWLPADIPNGAYLTLINTGFTPRVLVGAACPDFAAVSFHQTRTVNGVSEMSPVDTLTLRAQGSLLFAPGGYHIMLMQPLRALRPGDHVPITLRFADGSLLQVSFEVRAASAQSGSDVQH
jgi:copper(I)-binding protein